MNTLTLVRAAVVVAVAEEEVDLAVVVVEMHHHLHFLTGTYHQSHHLPHPMIPIPRGNFPTASLTDLQQTAADKCTCARFDDKA